MPAPVVIVDSNRDGLDMYVTALAIEGIAAESATSAGEALELIERGQPRAVVTELRLAGNTSIDLIRQVRRDQPRTFIVGLSTAPPDVEPARAAGCDVVLPVPCLPDTLVGQLRTALG